MTYLIKVWNRKDEARILKAFDKGKPVYIYPREYKKGKPFYEFGSSSEAMYAVDKIKKVEKWRHIDVIGIV